MAEKHNLKPATFQHHTVKKVMKVCMTKITSGELKKWLREHRRSACIMVVMYKVTREVKFGVMTKQQFQYLHRDSRESK